MNAAQYEGAGDCWLFSCLSAGWWMDDGDFCLSPRRLGQGWRRKGGGMQMEVWQAEWQEYQYWQIRAQELIGSEILVKM